MVIYRVKEGDTVAAIARRQGVLPIRLCDLNGIDPDTPPVAGQALVIDGGGRCYYVREGDSLRDIAARHRIPLPSLMRMNPALMSGEELYTGMTLTLENAEAPRDAVTVLGYAPSDTEAAALRPILPYLTYLALTGATADGEGRLLTVEDADAVAEARRAGVVPILCVSPATGLREERILENLPTDTLADAVCTHVRRRGYGGVLVDMPLALNAMHRAYTALLLRLRRSLGHGMAVLGTISPLALPRDGRILASLGRAASGLVLCGYDFASRYGAPSPESPYDRVKEALGAIKGCVRPQKLLLGLSTRAEDFSVHGGEGRVYAARDIPELAKQNGGAIAYDPVGRVPYLAYRDTEGDRIVFFEDAESICEKLSLCGDEGIGGIALFPAVNTAQPILSALATTFSVIRPYGR